MKHIANMTADVHHAALSVRLSSRSLQTWAAGSSRRSHAGLSETFRHVWTDVRSEQVWPKRPTPSRGRALP